MTIIITPNRKILPTTLAAAFAGILLLSGCTKQADDTVVTDNQTETQKVGDATPNAEQANIDRLLISYADMAKAAYTDSLDSAKLLQTAVNTYVDTPTEANLDAAKAAYKAARLPYSQTEVFRFDEGFVTANDQRNLASIDGWEGQVNAWPLDEALIDYVGDSYEGEYNSPDNIINSDSISVGSLKQDTSTITPELGRFIYSILYKP